MKNLLFLLLMISVLFSCRPEPLLIDIEPVEPKPVIWSQIIPENVVLVYFAKSFGALDFNEEDTTNIEQDLLDQILVNNGEIIIEHQGVDDTLIQLEQGLFVTFNTNLNVGDNYNLRARDFDLGQSVSSSATMLETVPLNSEITYELSEGFGDGTNVTIDYSFLDPPGENYYQVNFYTDVNDPTEDEGELDSSVPQFYQLISDQTYNTEQIEASYDLFNVESDSIFISLSNISKGYYEYLNQRDRGGSILNQLVNEPINYTSNIENGYGFFNLTAPNIRLITLD